MRLCVSSSSMRDSRALRGSPVLGGHAARLQRSPLSCRCTGASRDNHTAEGCPRAREAAGGAHCGRHTRAAGGWGPRRQRERLLQDRPQQVRPCIMCCTVTAAVVLVMACMPRLKNTSCRLCCVAFLPQTLHSGEQSIISEACTIAPFPYQGALSRQRHCIRSVL